MACSVRILDQAQPLSLCFAIPTHLTNLTSLGKVSTLTWHQHLSQSSLLVLLSARMEQLPVVIADLGVGRFGAEPPNLFGFLKKYILEFLKAVRFEPRESFGHL